MANIWGGMGEELAGDAGIQGAAKSFVNAF